MLCRSHEDVLTRPGLTILVLQDMIGVLTANAAESFSVERKINRYNIRDLFLVESLSSSLRLHLDLGLRSRTKHSPDIGLLRAAACFKVELHEHRL